MSAVTSKDSAVNTGCRIWSTTGLMFQELHWVSNIFEIPFV